VTKRIEGHQEADSVWLQVPDGYVRERGILFGALGPPSVIPFDAAHHLPKSQVRPHFSYSMTAHSTGFTRTKFSTIYFTDYR
jgi:hypothetical protein